MNCYLICSNVTWSGLPFSQHYGVKLAPALCRKKEYVVQLKVIVNHEVKVYLKGKGWVSSQVGFLVLNFSYCKLPQMSYEASMRW